MRVRSETAGPGALLCCPRSEDPLVDEGAGVVLDGAVAERALELPDEAGGAVCGVLLFVVRSEIDCEGTERCSPVSSADVPVAAAKARRMVLMSVFMRLSVLCGVDQRAAETPELRWTCVWLPVAVCGTRSTL